MTRRTAVTTPTTVPSLVSDDFPSVAATHAAGVAVAVPGLDDEEEKDEVVDDSVDGGVVVVGVLVVLSDGNDDDGATATTAVGSVAFGSGLASVADTTGAVAASTVVSFVPAAVFPAVAREVDDGRRAVVVAFAMSVERCGQGVGRS